MLQAVSTHDEIPEYPLTAEDRLDSHYFMPWERRRWLNSDMRLHGSLECRALFFDLINISYDQSPAGTLPSDHETLAKLLLVEPAHFRQLCRLEYGPLHKWHRVNCDGEVRLSHPMVLRSLKEAIARKEDHRARAEAASRKKRLQRLRIVLTELSPSLGKLDTAVHWIDEWLTRQGCEYRSPDWVERGAHAWTDHSLRKNMGDRSRLS